MTTLRSATIFLSFLAACSEEKTQMVAGDDAQFIDLPSNRDVSVGDSSSNVDNDGGSDEDEASSDIEAEAVEDSSAEDNGGDSGSDATADTSAEETADDAISDEDAVTDSSSDAASDGSGEDVTEDTAVEDSDDDGDDSDEDGTSDIADSSDGGSDGSGEDSSDDTSSEVDDTSADMEDSDTTIPTELWPQGVSPADFAEHRMLFVGNSYIYTNDLPSVYSRAAQFAEIGADNLYLRDYTVGGARLTGHLTAATTAGNALNTLFSTGDNVWDFVLLQEQSQILGFPPGEPLYEDSLDAGLELAEIAESRGATVVLMMTWGYRAGDSTNPAIFRDYEAMQLRLQSGYNALFSRISDAGIPVILAPVGLAFMEAWNWDESAAVDPLSASGFFQSLYSGDGSHPSPRGTYLAACVLLAEVAGLNVTRLDTPVAGIDDLTRDLLQEFAMRATN
jgi:hypothetical protein